MSELLLKLSRGLVDVRIAGVSSQRINDIVDKLESFGLRWRPPRQAVHQAQSFGQPGPYFITSGEKHQACPCQEVNEAGVRVLNRST